MFCAMQKVQIPIAGVAQPRRDDIAAFREGFSPPRAAKHLSTSVQTVMRIASEDPGEFRHR